VNRVVGPLDLPERDPRVPRFVWLVCLASLALAAVALGRGAAAVSPVAPVGQALAASGANQDAELFITAGCANCHPVTGAGSARGPGVGGVAESAAKRIAEPDYRGEATTVSDYLTEATVDHCLDPLPGWDCHEVPDVALQLTAGEVDRLVQFMLSLAPAVTP